MTTNNNNTTAKIGAQPQDLGRYFLAMASQNRAAAATDDDNEPQPTELNTRNCAGGYMVVAPDKLSIKYTGVNLHGHDVGVVQANKPAPTKRLVYYFEIFVKDAGQKGQIGIGFSTESFKMRRQPGWEANSCGYHGDDGFLYRGQGKGEPFGPTFTTGDTVGGGINYASQDIFFTKNGAIIGSVSKDIKGALFPTIAVHSQNEEVHVNFGQNPFVLDLKEYEALERVKQQAIVNKISLPSNISYRLIRSYLLHYGYEDTLNSFERASKDNIPPISIAEENGVNDQHIIYALIQRKNLRQLIMQGNIDAAFTKLREWFPQIVQDDKSPLCFLLHCQKFIELVRIGALEEAVKYGRIELAKFFGLVEFEVFVQDCVALLAYEKPQESSIGYLLMNSQRELVADSVNAAILATNQELKDAHACLQSYLERLIRQLTACCLEKRSLNGNQGEAFQLHRDVNSHRKSNC